MSAGFPRCRRLLNAEEYTRVFSKPKRSSDSLFTVLARPNESDLARLGLAVSKKNTRQAVDRNRIKRLVREDFRHIDLRGLDFVVMNRQGIEKATNEQIRASLHSHWNKLARLCENSSSS